MPFITLLTIIICLLLTLVYIMLMYTYRAGWNQKNDFELSPHEVPRTFISVIIPARNESANIQACIDSLLAQQYPSHLYEIIVVDDHSEDDTAAIVKSYVAENVSCISLADHITKDTNRVAYKKAALAAGISKSKGTLLLTTDADCVAPNTWLQYIAAIYELQDPVMIVAPVIYNTNKSIVQVFQLIDFMSMQGITAAAHQLRLGNMSNGANLAFSKAAYHQVGGYNGITHLASGDDYLLMMKLQQHKSGRVAYLKAPGAIVSTAPQPSWHSFFLQRIRWASKSGKYNDSRLTAILLLVYLFNLSFLVLTVAGAFHPVLFWLVAAMFVTKIVAEYLFIVPVARFFKKEWVLKYFPLLQPLHIAYIITAGFLGLIGGYTWKGRKVK